MYICVPLPMEIEAKLSQLKRENFFLWNFLSQNDLWDEAHEFLSEEAKATSPVLMLTKTMIFHFSADLL